MPELVAKTSAAIAVTDTLTTLLDWTNIEAFSNFTISVENAGGGSADDISDVQIDTSPDGGITINLDQQAGVLAVPITTGNAKTATFTETAAYVRVRALCASSQDTTAEAILIAESASARICTLADVKDRLGLTDTDHDKTINNIIAGMLGIFETECQRPLMLNAVDAVENYTAQGRYIQLDRFPVLAITSVKQSLDYDFANATALTVNTEYRLINAAKKGILYRVAIVWQTTPDSIEVKYRGGYIPAGQTPTGSETALPADIREAAIEQVTFLWKRRDDIGLSGVSFDGGSISKFQAIKLLPQVQDVLKNYKKTTYF